jgi:hypothetical protein
VRVVGNNFEWVNITIRGEKAIEPRSRESAKGNAKKRLFRSIESGANPRPLKRGSPLVGRLLRFGFELGGLLVVAFSWFRDVPLGVEVDEALQAFFVVAQGDALFAV